MSDWMDDLWDKHGAEVIEMVLDGFADRHIANTLEITRHKARKLISRAKAETGHQTTEKVVTDTDEAKGYRHEYRQATGDYVFWMPNRAGALVLKNAVVRQMKLDYTGGHTMEEVARANSITTNEFYGIKRALGWRKSSLPLLDRDMEDMTEDEIADDLLAIRKRNADVKARQKEWRAIEKDARKWRELMDGQLEPVQTVLSEYMAGYTPPKPTEGPKGPVGEWALVYSPTDLHYGKYHWARYGGGGKFDRERCAERLDHATRLLMQRMPGRPDTIISCIGSDWFNADNVGSRTSSYRNVMDMDGTPEQMWEEGYKLALDVHYILRQHTEKVVVVLQEGNHDTLLSRVLFTVLQEHFRDDPAFEFHDGRGVYNYLQYGNSMFCITHGHGQWKAKDLANIMSHERAKMWGETKYRYALTGNLHHYAVHEDGGVVCFLLPSLSGSDRYHTRQGYMLARPGLMGLCFDRETGFMGQVFAPTPDELL